MYSLPILKNLVMQSMYEPGGHLGHMFISPNLTSRVRVESSLQALETHKLGGSNTNVTETAEMHS